LIKTENSKIIQVVSYGFLLVSWLFSCLAVLCKNFSFNFSVARLSDRPSSAALWLRHINDANSSDTDGDKALAVGAMIVEELRAAIKDQTSFQCSAGVAHNKVLYSLITLLSQ
jgi:hypothetical protein